MTRRVSQPASRHRRRDEYGSFVYVLSFARPSRRRRPRPPAPTPQIMAAAPAVEPPPSEAAMAAPVQPRQLEDA
jgi:hypothetical protein